MAKLTSIEPFLPVRTSSRAAVNSLLDFSSLRLVIGGVLLMGALFKIRYLEYYPPDIFSASRSAWLLFAASEFELCLCAWLFIGVYERWLQWTTAATFFAFGTYSLARAASGVSDCRCFGDLALSPWFVACGDLLIGLIIAVSSPPRLSEARGIISTRPPRLGDAALIVAAVALTAAIVIPFRPLVDWYIAHLSRQPLIIHHPVQIVEANSTHPLTAAFAATNPTESDVIVVGMQTACGCVSAEQLPLVIAAGETRMVKFDIAAGSPLRRVTQNIRLFIDKPASPLVVRVIVMPADSS